MPDAIVTREGLTVLGGLSGNVGSIPGAPDGTRSLALLGWAGGDQWPIFAASPEYSDGRPHPLDRWTKRIVDRLAGDLGAQALYPSDGPPWYPFQRWAMAAGIGFPSPIGLLIHPRFGLWHSYRAALAFSEETAVPFGPPASGVNPCETCIDRPCLTTCPVGAYGPERFDVRGCRAHVAGPSGDLCRTEGCLARNACPVGLEWRNSPAQIRFHQDAFLKSDLG